ncbi:MAG: hypothetical protein EBU90_06795 [Proteobacteria bacterium]|jgi:hypothetical protein|nr:hypothetical protein [Pseudomonadota bacterium]NBP14045.1 hypothetical protein [bacterium]
MCYGGFNNKKADPQPTYTPPQAPYIISSQYAISKNPQNADTSGVENNNQQYTSYMPNQTTKQFNFKLYSNNNSLSQSGVNTLE